MEKTNKKLKKHIIENDVNSLVIFKIPDDYYKIILLPSPFWVRQQISFLSSLST